MKPSEMAKLVSKQGCTIKRHGSRHDIWFNPKTGGESSIPRHKSQDIPKGTAERILTDLGLK